MKHQKHESSKGDTQNSQELPSGIQKGDRVACIDSSIQSKKTAPPPRFTEASLAEAMGKVHTFVSDPKIKKRLKENSGIGTEATRTMIIQNLFSRSFIEKKGKHIVSSPTGRAIIDSVPEQLTDPGVTALWEDFLESVARGKSSLNVFLNDQEKMVYKLVDALINTSYEKHFESVTQGKIHKCPECGNALQRKKSKKGQMYWGCFNTEKHNNEKPVFLPDDNGSPGTFKRQAPLKEEKCPKCGNPSYLKESNKKKGFFFWVCSTKKCPLYKDNNGSPGEEMQFKKSK